MLIRNLNSLKHRLSTNKSKLFRFPLFNTQKSEFWNSPDNFYRKFFYLRQVWGGGKEYNFFVSLLCWKRNQRQYQTWKKRRVVTFAIKRVKWCLCCWRIWVFYLEIFMLQKQLCWARIWSFVLWKNNSTVLNCFVDAAKSTAAMNSKKENFNSFGKQ